MLFRHDTHPNRSALAKMVARLCRKRGVALIVSGDARLAKSLRVGLHLRGGAGGRPYGWSGGILSASVHNAAQLRQARRGGVSLAFISPVFATSSHPGAQVLGVSGWRGLASQAGKVKPCALGGINGQTVRRLGPLCAGIGAIEAFFPVAQARA